VLELTMPAGAAVDGVSTNLGALTSDGTRLEGDTSKAIPLYAVGYHGSFDTVSGAWLDVDLALADGTPLYGSTLAYYVIGTGGLGASGTVTLDRPAPYVNRAVSGSWAPFGSLSHGYGSLGGSLLGWSSGGHDWTLGWPDFITQVSRDGGAVNWSPPQPVAASTPAQNLRDGTGYTAAIGAATGAPQLIETLSLSQPRVFQMAVYVIDHGNQGRSELVSVDDAVGNQNVSLSGFSGGEWVVFRVAGSPASPVTLAVRSWSAASAVASAILLD
jgi:hypothetical protein